MEINGTGRNECGRERKKGIKTDKERREIKKERD